MSTVSGDTGTVLQTAPARRGWYELEARHGAMARGRAIVLALLAAVAIVAPLDLSGRERLLAALVCVAGVAMHALLVWIPGRWPRRLLGAVDVGLVVDAAVVGGLALTSGGSDSLALWLLPLFCLAVTLALGIGPAIKALILSALVLGWVATSEAEPASALTDSLGPLALAAAVVVVAGLLAPLNERELRRRRERLATLHAASVAFVDADDVGGLATIAEDAGRALLPGWTVEVGLGSEPTQERHWRADGRAFLEIPIVARNREEGGGRPLGALTASRELARVGRTAVRADSVMALRTLATALSAALVQHDLLLRLERQSKSDPLTGLANRRSFDEALPLELARARRAGAWMGVAMLDVDHFKQFNDRYGHQAGDDALIAVARVLAREARAGDLACRIGGEEFALLLPGADEMAASAVAERVRAAIERLPAPTAGMTVSLGVAATRNDDAGELLARADARLYAAKTAGRNRVVAG